MRRALVLFALVTPLVGSCSADKPSSIVVALSSEAPIPTGIDALRVKVEAGGEIKFDKTYPVGPDSKEKLPGTLVVNREDTTDKATPVTISVIGMRGDIELTHRRATLGFSEGKQKLLRMPVQFACFDTTCEAGETCKSGACVPDSADAEALPEFTESQVFPIAGQCFDRDACIEKTEHEVPFSVFLDKVKTDPTFFDTKNCTLPTDSSAVGTDVNMGFTWSINPDGTWTAVDFDAEEGWQFSDDTHKRIKLSPGLCKELQKDAPRIKSIVTAAACKPKTPTQPECPRAATTN